MNRKGLTEQFTFILMFAVVLFLIIGVISLISLIFPVIFGAGSNAVNLISTATHNTQPNTNLDNTTQQAATITTNAFGAMQGVNYLIIIGMILGFLIIAFYVKSYPYLAFIWIGLAIIMVMFSLFISVSYQTAKSTNNDLNSFYSTWGSNDFLMNNLPIITTVLGILGSILIFAIRGGDVADEAGVQL